MSADQWATLSNTSFSIAVGLYSLAVIAFCAELAFGGVRQADPVRELVGAGGPVERPRPPQDLAPPPESDRGRRYGALAMGLTVLGALAHLTVLVARAAGTDRWPWGNMYEFATASVLVAVVAYLSFAFRAPSLRHIGVFVMGPAVLCMVLVGLFLYAEAGPVVASLRSAWLAVHVSSVVLAMGLFFTSGIASVMYLVRTRYDARVLAGDAPASRVVHRLPLAATLDRTAHRIAICAFPIWTFGVIAGAIWAESAWGRFWGWDPKETWAFIAWVVYAAYLHARATAGWRGRPAAWVNVIGLVVMIFNLLYVNLVSTGLHSYAGVGN
ncbi:c-type cytochrome biogenesis protein CcsB [Modestobacter sp. I12A-02628]|uniref:C-type cytochrome biogenesis protein CcsB n=1 Tax=Goekera deserti TaxID=2497753 RepID=A0A7K3W915_9ACTN|nr:c-type cytochrome biogenesis protein CcsB [Goekera deserti]MPR00505.1 c-type cytochrome biogenesis protein CcsB [Goekera deserti]NDI49096.1 c-type cytochrome biogenesis protein CcsB [Goekera deserti]NEL52834.1 c-type cytochrome biogenesis protein CcsB [Goekera deserti]